MINKRVNLSTSDEKWHNGYVKPKGKFWKRLFNKRVRKGDTHKRNSWFHWN